MSGERLIQREECKALLERAHALGRGGGETGIRVGCWWHGELRWARNEIRLVSDRRDISVRVSRTLPGGNPGFVTTNQLDDLSLEAAVRAAERKSRIGDIAPGRGLGYYPPFPRYEPFRDTTIWSDATYELTAQARGDIARSCIDAAEARGLVSAGYIEARAGAVAEYSTDFPELRTTEHIFWEQPYVSWTQAQCSMTIRDPQGTGSGWSGYSSYDWARINTEALVEGALEKCHASRNPVALEPGRYTVVLEPQAVADLMEILVGSFEMREGAERHPTHPWFLAYDRALGLGRSKLNIKVADSRITISHDPRDPELGIIMHPLERPGPVTWIDQGILTDLPHLLRTGIRSLEDRYTLRGATGYRMSGGETSIDEMIRTTRRGLLVTRFSNIRTLNETSLLATGLTRDGLWLIEDGKISKAVKNFRFTESPLFALNSIEQLGEPVPVFRPTKTEGGKLTPAIVPPLKVRDFSFTSLIDAV